MKKEKLFLSDITCKCYCRGEMCEEPPTLNAYGILEHTRQMNLKYSTTHIYSNKL